MKLVKASGMKTVKKASRPTAEQSTSHCRAGCRPPHTHTHVYLAIRTSYTVNV